MTINPDEHVDSDERAAAADPSVGDGSPETAPWREPAVSWLRRQPVIAALLAVNLPLVTGLVSALAAGNTNPTVVALLGVAVVLLNAVGAVVRQAVTPTARPRLDKDTPLTPPGV